MTKESTDEELMEAFRQGQRAAFDALFNRHAPLVRGYLRRLLSSPTQADDVLQNTFLSVVRSKDRFRTGERFKPWLYAIATNAAKDAFRRTPAGSTALEDASELELAFETHISDEGLRREVRHAMAQLPEAQRSAILLHWFEGLSFAEVAAAEGISESAVKVRAHRGYEKLRPLLEKVWTP
jgi:RNA polymerase sigma-70 factor (ECF subfamily)